MAIYIDPSAAVNGSGTEISPFNVPPGTLTGNTYLFKRGTTYRKIGGGNAIFVGTAGNVIIGSYGTGNSPCVVDCSEANRGISIGTNIANVTVEDDAIRIANVGAGSNRRGISNATTGSSGTVATNIRIGRIIIENVGTDNANDCNGVSLFGSGNVLDGTIIREIADDAVWFRGNLQVLNADIRGIDRSGRGNGDCIQGNSTVSNDCNGWVVKNSRLDHSDRAAKQCFIINASGGGGSGGIFAFNDVYGHNDAAHTTVYIDWANVLVLGNTVRGGVVGISIIGLTYSGSRVIGNLIINSYGRGLDLGQDGTIATNNTIIGIGNTGTGIRHNNTNATGNQIRNNIVQGFQTGITLTTGCDENYNCVFGATTPVSGATIGAQSLTTNPLLDEGYKLTTASSCKGTGVYIAGAKHFGGVSVNLGAPDIGAFRYFEARAIRGVTANTVVTREITTRTTHIFS